MRVKQPYMTRKAVVGSSALHVAPNCSDATFFVAIGVAPLHLRQCSE